MNVAFWSFHQGKPVHVDTVDVDWPERVELLVMMAASYQENPKAFPSDVFLAWDSDNFSVSQLSEIPVDLSVGTLERIRSAVLGLQAAH